MEPEMDEPKLNVEPINNAETGAGPGLLQKTRDETRVAQSKFRTPTTLFSDSPITPSEEYVRVVSPERRKLLVILFMFVTLGPLMFRYVCGSSSDRNVDSRSIGWATGIDSWEWSVLIVLWLGILGSIFRLIPMVSGRPSSIEASQQCKLDGVAALGLCSPFSSEDDAILLRSLLGRTCTVFHTVGSRHGMQGLYLDTILNERRIKGEANRRNCWLAWMKFLNALVDVSLLMKEEAAVAAEANKPTSPQLPPLPLPPRPLYLAGAHGVGSSTPIRRQTSADTPTSAPTPRTMRFKDVGAVFDASRGVSEEKRTFLSSWSRDQQGDMCLSTSMADHSATGLSRRVLVYPDGDHSADGHGHGHSHGDAAQRRRPMRKLLSLVPEGLEPDAAAEDAVEDSTRRPGLPSGSDSFRVDSDHSDSVPPDQATEHAEDGAHVHAQDHRSWFYTQVADSADSKRQRHPFSGGDGHADEHSDQRNDVLSHGIAGSGDVEMATLPARNGSPTKPERADSRRSTLDRAGSGTGHHLDTPNRLQNLISGLSIITRMASFDPHERQEYRQQSHPQQPLQAFSVDPCDMPAEAALPDHHPRQRAPTFLIAPTPRARKMSPRQKAAAASYTRPHGISNMDLNMADLVPMIDFLDAWLEEMKNNEWTYDYYQPEEAIDKLFFAAPFMSHFKGHHMLAVHAALDTLYDAFSTRVPDEPDPKRPYHPDEVSEVAWVLHRKNLPDWTVIWSYASRARLREMKRSDIEDPQGPDPVYQSTRIKPGAIVYRRPPSDVMAEFAPAAYFRQRRALYKVSKIDRSWSGEPLLVHLIPFCPREPLTAVSSDLETGVGNEPPQLSARLDELELVEKNRGKTGALNFFNDYLRAKAVRWSGSLGMNHPIQTFTGIVDARHALVETDIFWNDALPYFAKVMGQSLPSKRFGSLSEHSICITVQYPQFFTNVGDDDVLDNSNSTYYNLWQTLRDGAKCICSSGTNTIWDISDPTFEFCTESRSEDLGTSHEHIPHSASVYLCIYVAYGIAKKTEDFLEALYRWSAGPLELLWPSFFQWKILKQYIYVAIPTTVMALASFHEWRYWYIIHLGMVALFTIKAVVDKRSGRKPLRDFAVATVMSINLFIVCSNLMSVMWMVVFPSRIAFFGILPMGRTVEQGLFWGWISLFVSLPTGIVHDALIRIARHTAPGTKQLNYHNCLWRGSQLYANSFMFTLMATIAGSWSAYKAWAWDYDLSMWSSFRIGSSEFDKLNKSVERVPILSSAYAVYLYRYAVLYANSCLAALTMPTVMTKWYVTCVLLLQVACIFVSTFIVNRDKTIHLAVVLFTCSLNILMTIEVAILLQPALKGVVGYPFRAEYIFGLLGLIIVISALVNGALAIDTIAVRVRLG